MCGGHGRSVFTAACLAVSRYFATAGRCSAAFAHVCEGIPRRPSNRTFVAVPHLKKKHTSSSTMHYLSLIGDEEVVSLSHAKVYVFSDSVLCFGKMSEAPLSNTVWERQWGWFKDSSQNRALDTIDGEPLEFEWNISQDSPHCSSSTKSKSS